MDELHPNGGEELNDLATGDFDVATTLEHSPRQLIREQTMNPLMLLERAVERGMDPEQLRALVDLHEQWRAARAKEAFAAAMNACQAEMPVIVRDAENTHTRSRYARLDGIVHSAKPIYTANGFALSFSEAETGKEGFKRIVCDIVHREGHSERRWLDLPIDGVGSQGGKSSMNAVQACISTGSYGQRVLICRIFNITIADTDLDGGVPPPRFENPNHNPHSPTERPRAKRQQPQGITKEQQEHVKRYWLTKNQDPDGNVERMRAAFVKWAREVTGRTEHFDPTKPAQWTDEDYVAACKALNMPTLEDVARENNG